MTENIQKDSEFYRKAVKFNGMAIIWVAFDVCVTNISLDTIKYPNDFSFLNRRWRNDEKSFFEQFTYILKILVKLTMNVITFET